MLCIILKISTTTLLMLTKNYFFVIWISSKKNEISQVGEINKEYLIGFCNKAIHCQMLVDKQSRWLGFLQGVLFSMGLITIQEEREFSRQLFQEIYRDHGLQQETRSVFYQTPCYKSSCLRLLAYHTNSSIHQTFTA